MPGRSHARLQGRRGHVEARADARHAAPAPPAAADVREPGQVCFPGRPSCRARCAAASCSGPCCHGKRCPCFGPRGARPDATVRAGGLRCVGGLGATRAVGGMAVPAALMAAAVAPRGTRGFSSQVSAFCWCLHGRHAQPRHADTHLCVCRPGSMRGFMAYLRFSAHISTNIDRVCVCARARIHTHTHTHTHVHTQPSPRMTLRTAS